MPRVVPLMLVVLALSSRASAGVLVSSFQTVAHTNAYAPLDQSAYYSTQTQANISPASATVSADWTGTNVGGSATTWRWIGTAHTSITTAVSNNALNITGSGSFGYDLTTTSAFVDPTTVTTLYGPGSASDFQGVFSVDAPSVYALSVQLNQHSLVQLASFSTGLMLRQRNINSPPFTFTSSAVLPPGQYQLLVNSSSGPPSGLFNGLNRESGNGGFGNLLFTVQVPEPSVALLLVSGAGSLLAPRGRKAVHSAKIAGF